MGKYMINDEYILQLQHETLKNGIWKDDFQLEMGITKSIHVKYQCEMLGGG